ncbi:hypothetical protein RhiJN_05707 [Ceratobasidium sp. AG-Ba]|nr:hypothetical protein RhiJN_05707 [Ceratobasidium sp. AG-Ba]QRW06638.1 hypothetical protein RhiLY_05637 [Ceratobasidium sp. AG-Ba]
MLEPTNPYAIFVNVCEHLYTLRHLFVLIVTVFLLTSLAACVVFSTSVSSAVPPCPMTKINRGIQHLAIQTPVTGPFHPQPQPTDDDPILSVVHVLIDNVMLSTTNLFWRAMSVTSFLIAKATRVFYTAPYLVETFVLPIKTRIRQTIVQISAPVVVTANLSYRYIVPVLTQLALFNMLVSALGVPIPLAGFVCFVGCITLLVSDRTRVVGEGRDVNSKADSTPEMAGVGQAAILNART